MFKNQHIALKELQYKYKCIFKSIKNVACTICIGNDFIEGNKLRVFILTTLYYEKR